MDAGGRPQGRPLRQCCPPAFAASACCLGARAAQFQRSRLPSGPRQSLLPGAAQQCPSRCNWQHIQQHLRHEEVQTALPACSSRQVSPQADAAHITPCVTHGHGCKSPLQGRQGNSLWPVSHCASPDTGLPAWPHHPSAECIFAALPTHCGPGEALSGVPRGGTPPLG